RGLGLHPRGGPRRPVGAGAPGKRVGPGAWPVGHPRVARPLPRRAWRRSGARRRPSGDRDRRCGPAPRRSPGGRAAAGLARLGLSAPLVFGPLFYVLTDSALALFGGVLPQANFAILLVAITSFDLKTRRNCYSSLWISLAILYLAAVYAWDYAFGILLALWTLYLAGFWIASHLKRMEAGVRVPARALALTPAAGRLGGVGWAVP